MMPMSQDHDFAASILYGTAMGARRYVSHA